MSESPIYTIFYKEQCFSSKLIAVVSQFITSKISFIDVNLQPKSVRTELLKHSPTKTFPILKTKDDLFISGGLPIINLLLEEEGEIKKLLIGDCTKTEAMCNMWMNFFNTTLTPILEEINMQMKGVKPLNQAVLDMAICDLMTQLKVVNEHLIFKTFFVGHSVLLPDLMFGCYLFNMTQLVLTEKQRSEIPHVVRHFRFVSTLKHMMVVLGEAKEIKEMAQPIPFVEIKEEVIEEQVEGKIKSKKQEKKEKQKQNKEENFKKGEEKKKEKQLDKQKNESKEGNKADKK